MDFTTIFTLWNAEEAVVDTRVEEIEIETIDEEKGTSPSGGCIVA